MKYLLVISNNLRTKINKFSSFYQHNILANLESVINDKLFLNEVQKREQETIIYRINYGYKLELFFTFFQNKNQQKIIKCLDIFEKSKLKTIVIFGEDIIAKAKIIDIDINFNSQENNLLNLEIIKQLTIKDNLKISAQDLENQLGDLYYYDSQSLKISTNHHHKILISLNN